MNAHGTEELQDQLDDIKVEAAVRGKFNEQQFIHLFKQLNRIESRLDRLDEKIFTLTIDLASATVAIILIVLMGMMFILNFATPLALLRVLPTEVAAAPAPASLPDAKPAKDNAQQVIRGERPGDRR